MNKAILTIATGKKLYIDLASNLARSFYFWNPNSAVTFQIVTDNPELLPNDIKEKSKIIIVQPGEFGEGFSTKLQLDKLAGEGQTLFIDSDCLIFGNIDFLFDRFNNHDVSVVGAYLSKGEWFGDIESICRKFNVPHLPKFNGGIYYIEKGAKASEVYATARELEKRYDEIGFIRLRNRPNDEVLMALAMQLHGQTPINDDGTIMSDPQACQGGYKIDIINGKRLLTNPPAPSNLHQSWYPFHEVSPVIVHFLGYYTQHYPYLREVYRLKKAINNTLSNIDNLKSLIIIEYPLRFKNCFKNSLRPLYHLLFGARMVKKSERL
ncbi:hypothetical protein [Mucilaginibacter sp.]|uniref:hypothetical protein n=1 Tax=Mucilaginibacter sp. TaxID=1882438 RepID=UPI00284AC29C|nr:hypothetical protein [Mucilaginibacter sp.]MDR3695468.1 hypothetical protein [Mucilaginibacter sp.]